MGDDHLRFSKVGASQLGALFFVALETRKPASNKGAGVFKLFTKVLTL